MVSPIPMTKMMMTNKVVVSSSMRRMMNRTLVSSTSTTTGLLLSSSPVVVYPQNKYQRNQQKQQIRSLNVHEYISMELMSSHGIQTPECHVAETIQEVDHIYNTSFTNQNNGTL